MDATAAALVNPLLFPVKHPVAFKNSVVRIIEELKDVKSQFNKSTSATTVLAISTSLFALAYIYQNSKGKWNESLRDQVGRLALNIPFVKAMFLNEVKKEETKLIQSVQKKWEHYGTKILEIPEKGWSFTNILRVLEEYTEIVQQEVYGKHISGSIYSKSLDKPHHQSPVSISFSPSQEPDINAPDYFEKLSYKLQAVYNLVYDRTNLWNLLHDDEFGIGSFINYCCISMLANRYGARPEEVMGFITTGGTESLMTMVRAYRDWGRAERNHDIGQGVIIVCKTVHAAVKKGCIAYDVKCVEVECDEKGRVDINAMRSALERHGKNVIGVVGSSPSYPFGVIDPLEEIGQLALEYKVPFHIDDCLGGFVDEKDTKDKLIKVLLKILGVTSMSADFHKNGMAPKGVAGLVFKHREDLGEKI